MQGQPMNKVIFIGTIHFNRTLAQSGKDPSPTASEMQSSLTLFPNKRGHSTGWCPFQDFKYAPCLNSLHATSSHQQASHTNPTWTDALFPPCHMNAYRIWSKYFLKYIPAFVIRRVRISIYFFAKTQLQNLSARLWRPCMWFNAGLLCSAKVTLTILVVKQ